MDGRERVRVLVHLLRRLIWSRGGLIRDLRDAARYTLGRRARLQST
jgi:hypothetical protein